MPDSLQPHQWQHAGLPCPLSPGVCSNSCLWKSVMPSNYVIICNPFFLLPSAFPSIRVFSNESALHMGWPEYWSFSFSISPSSEWSGLISFRIDRFELKSCPRDSQASSPAQQFESFNTSALNLLYMVLLSHLYITTGKTVALTRSTFVSKVISLLFNTLSRFVLAFLPRSKDLLISWLQ